MARSYKGDCIGSAEESTSGATIKGLPVKIQAKRALVQFFTDSAGITAIGRDNLGVTPITKVTEDGTNPAAGTGLGMGLYHMGVYEIIGQSNIRNFKFMANATGYTVYAKISFYK